MEAAGGKAAEAAASVQTSRGGGALQTTALHWHRAHHSASTHAPTHAHICICVSKHHIQIKTKKQKQNYIIKDKTITSLEFG